MAKNTFTSRLTAALSMIGVAVGLGNVWRFPYMMGSYGGSTFLFIYLIFIILFAIPALTGEWSLGRYTGKGTFGTFAEAFGNKTGKVLACILISTIFIANSYYLVVIAHVLYSAFHSGIYGFNYEKFTVSDGLNNNLLQFSIAFGVLLMALAIIYLGLRKGIERISKLFVPFFGFAMIYILFHTLRLPGTIDHLIHFIKPHVSELNIKNIFAAMGQAFFSLGLGGTILVIYGSYLKPKENLPKLALFTGFGDLSASLLASLFIVPTVLVYGLDIQEGYTLLFSTLPVLFKQMQGGQFLGTLFLISLFFIAFLSSVAVLQLILETLTNNTKLNIKKSLFLMGTVELILIIICAFHSNIIPVLDLVFGSGMMVLGSCIAIIALTWKFGKSVTISQIFNNRHGKFQSFYFIWLKWAIPIALILTLILYIYDNIPK